MYSIVARLLLKPGMREQYLALAREIEIRGIPGWVAEYLYQSDANPDEFFMAVVFESEDAYQKNAESLEMDAACQRMRAMLAADPEWHDGAVVYAKVPGGR
jgi:quinol monooxygenase YgiN